jgi:hypothetical protein
MPRTCEARARPVGRAAASARWPRARARRRGGAHRRTWAASSAFASGSTSAATAARCAIVGAETFMFWLSASTHASRCAGTTIQPRRQPVIE